MRLKKVVTWLVTLGDGSKVPMTFAQSDRTTTSRYFPVVKDGPSVAAIQKRAKAKQASFEKLWSVSNDRNRKNK